VHVLTLLRNCIDNTDQPKMYIIGNVGYYATRFYKNFKYDPKLHRKKNEN